MESKKVVVVEVNKYIGTHFQYYIIDELTESNLIKNMTEYCILEAIREKENKTVFDKVYTTHYNIIFQSEIKLDKLDSLIVLKSSKILYLPPNIRSLDVRNGNSLLEYQGEYPQSLRKLHISEYTSDKELYIPPQIKTFGLSDSTYGGIHDKLPDSIETFVYGGLENLDNLPTSLKHLSILSPYYDCELNCLPLHLETLTIRKYVMRYLGEQERNEIHNKPKKLQIKYID